MPTQIQVIQSNNKSIVFFWKALLPKPAHEIWIPSPWFDYTVSINADGNPNLIVHGPESESSNSTLAVGSIFGVRIVCSRTGKRLLEQLVDQPLPRSLDELQGRISKHAAQLANERPRYKSVRQQSRDFKKIYGVSKTQLEHIKSVHRFLARECGYSPTSENITHHIDYSRYYDQPHFNKLFLKVTGMNPTDFFKTYEGLGEQLMSFSYKLLDENFETIQAAKE